METFDARISLSFGMIISGPPKSGKTTFMLNLFKHSDRIFSREFDYIVWFYGVYNKTVEYLENNYSDKIKTVQGLPDNVDEYLSNDKDVYGLVVFDDLMTEVSDSKLLAELTSRKCQHQSISWIVILQNLFYKSKERLTLQRNAHYMCIFHNPLDRSVIQYMANRIMPKNQKIFLKIYERAAARPHGYLFLDGTQNCPEIARLRTDIFHYYQRIFFVKE